MGFGKAFAIGLIIFMALTFVFALIVAALNEAIGIGNFFSTLVNPLSNLGGALFGSVALGPETTLMALMLALAMGALDLTVTLALLSPLIVMLIAAIITGRLAEGKGAAFGAWLLICIIASVVLLVFAIIGGAAISVLGIIMALTPAIINGIFYGCFALLASGSEYY
jgi:hypothetical protein